jgi:hypothetical protein
MIVKPVIPVEPKWQDYPNPDLPSGANYLGEPLYQKLDWVRDISKYQKAMEKYDKDMFAYKQYKLLRLIRNSSDEYCLEHFIIAKR